MLKVLYVLKHEVYMVVSRKEYWFMLLFPLVIVLLLWGVMLANQQKLGQNGNMNIALDAVGDFMTPDEDTRPKGYVDTGGIIRDLPPDFPEDALIAYPDLASARQALDADEISAFYAISPDYLVSGTVTIYMPEFDLSMLTNSNEFKTLLNYNLLGGNDVLYRSYLHPVSELEQVSLAPARSIVRENNSQAAMFICIAISMILYMGIFGSSSMLISSLTSERENRVVEVLILSTSPMELLAGKIIGLGLLGLVQMIFWLPGMVFVLRFGGSMFALPQELMLNPSFILWGILFFLGGYLLYAAIMSGIGVLIHNAGEASQITTIVLFPAIISEILSPIVSTDPHGSVSVFFSLFPLTSPFMMMMRNAMDMVPLWQILLSLLLLLLSALLVIRLAAGMFRAQMILTGSGFHPSNIFRLFRKV